MKFRLSEAARRDLESIERYLLERTPGAVDGVLDDIEAACDLYIPTAYFSS